MSLKNWGYLKNLNKLYEKRITGSPRKTFSMGHSYDKRYYLEARMSK